MAEFKLRRSGRAPLKFNGELLAEASSRAEKKTNRKASWHEIRVYRTAGGKYVLQVEYNSDYRQETPAWTAEVCDKASDVRSMLETYDPTLDVTGFPPEPSFASRQKTLLDETRRRFSAIVSEILEADDDFAERID